MRIHRRNHNDDAAVTGTLPAAGPDHELAFFAAQEDRNRFDDRAIGCQLQTGAELAGITHQPGLPDSMRGVPSLTHPSGLQRHIQAQSLQGGGIDHAGLGPEQA